jgi:hypothetical protein
MNGLSATTTYPYDFDEISSVEYKDISRLYYGKYPYKVLIWGKAKISDIPSPLWHWNSAISKSLTINRNHYSKLKEYCSNNIKDLWHSQNNSTKTFSFFFYNRDDAKDFIKIHQEFVLYVHRARNQNEVDVLSVHSRRELRDILYWNRFKYAIDFYEEDNDQLDKDILSIFPNKRKNSSRFRLIMNKKRRLLLNDENDLLYVYIALSDKIEKQSEAILREKINARRNLS